MLDLLLACLHHLLIFAVFATLLSEFLLLRPGFSAATLERVARIDLLYGLSAGALVAVGLSRAVFAAKGWPYYSHNLWFWAKLSTFGFIAILSISPTLTIMRWRRLGRLGQMPDEAAVRGVRRVMHWELTLLILLPLFAAAMARGFGEF
jgi:putative membrane protein